MDRQATTTPNTINHVDKETLVFAIIDVLGYDESELWFLSFNTLKELATKQVWSYIKENQR